MYGREDVLEYSNYSFGTQYERVQVKIIRPKYRMSTMSYHPGKIMFISGPPNEVTRVKF